tara:strand:- start:1099 stop:1437 length:339 start_codon:yes stop_codon:yes gene_type:complete
MKTLFESWNKFVNENEGQQQAALARKLIDVSSAVDIELNAGEASVLGALQDVTRQEDLRAYFLVQQIHQGVITKEMALKFIALFEKYPALITSNPNMVGQIENIVNAYFKEG